jgi:3-oxoacyl-[acyl-carrier-protein] synthase III
MHGSITGVDYYLPEQTLSNADLLSEFPCFNFERLSTKTGIKVRHVASSQESSADLAITAAMKLFVRDPSIASSIDYLLLCTQSPENILPATACTVQERLGIPRNAGALDYNLGCSGFIYGLGIAEGLIATSQAHRVLLLTSDTITRYLSPHDERSRALFGDAAAATLIDAVDDAHLGPFVYGTDGRGKDSLTVLGPRCGNRLTSCENNPHGAIAETYKPTLIMDGPRVFSFALEEVPQAVYRLLAMAQMKAEDIKLFVFHQANRYLVEELYRSLDVPPCKQHFSIEHCGNTSSSSIPIALHHAALEGRVFEGDRILIVGFGVGFSWSATIVRWSNSRILPR